MAGIENRIPSGTRIVAADLDHVGPGRQCENWDRLVLSASPGIRFGQLLAVGIIEKQIQIVRRGATNRAWRHRQLNSQWPAAGGEDEEVRRLREVCPLCRK